MLRRGILICSLMIPACGRVEYDPPAAGAAGASADAGVSGSPGSGGFSGVGSAGQGGAGVGGQPPTGGIGGATGTPACFAPVGPEATWPPQFLQSGWASCVLKKCGSPGTICCAARCVPPNCQQYDEGQMKVMCLSSTGCVAPEDCQIGGELPFLGPDAGK
jgi:hypothetical protein